MNLKDPITLVLLGSLTLPLWTPQGHADGGVPLWTNRYGGRFPSGAGAAAVDREGNVFVTGAQFPQYPLTNQAVTVAYSPAGVPLWTNLYSGPGYYAYFHGIGVDGNGNVFLTGFEAIGLSGGEYVTVAYSNTGVPLWTNRYHGLTPGNDGANALAVDNHGNVLVTGTSLDSGGYLDYATLAYSGAGVPLWTNRYRSTAISYSLALAMAVDNNGNVFVTGQGARGYETVAYSGAGAPLWTNCYSGATGANSRANGVAVDKRGNVFVTGYAAASDGTEEFSTVAYSGAGFPLWTNHFQGPNRDDYAHALVVDANGNVIVLGQSASTNAPPAIYDYAMVAYSGAGLALWTNRYAGPGEDWDGTAGLAVDSGGNVILAGTSVHGSGSPQGTHFLVAACSSAGVPLWTNECSGPQKIYNGALSLAVDSNDNVIATGSSSRSNSYDFLTLKYSSSVLPASIQVSPLARLPDVPDLIVIATNNVDALVVLEALSADPDRDPLTYQWFNDADLLPVATGSRAADGLALGTHTIRLAVDDGRSAAGSATVRVEIISPCQAVGMVMDLVENSNLTGPERHSLLVLLQVACQSFERGRRESGIEKLEVFEHKARTQLRRSDPALAQKLAQMVQVIINAL